VVKFYRKNTKAMKEIQKIRGKAVTGLALCGGGGKGYYQLIILRELEKRLPEPLHHYFDYIGGVSTGIISGACIGSGMVTCSKALEIYAQRGEDIFRKRWWRKMGLFRPKYKREALDKALKDFLGDMKLGETKSKMLAVSIKTSDCTEYTVFKSTKEEHKNMLLRDICGKSASAPTYFPADTTNDRIDIDGGLAENNPSMVVLSEMVRKEKSDSYFVVSIGTGNKAHKLSKKHVLWGAIQWVTRLPNVFLQQNSAMTTYYMETIAESTNVDLVFHRLNGDLINASTDIDDASPENLKKLSEDAYRYVLSKDVSEQLDQIAETLKNIKS